MELNSYICSESNGIRVHGRISNRKTDGIPLFWTASAIEFNITGKELWLEYYCEYNSGESYLRVEIDGADMYRFMLEEGQHKICIMRGFPPSETKNIRIFRETQASNTVILLKSLYSDGEFQPLEKRNYRMEFFGDSVTSGEGLAGAQKLNSWIPAVFSCRNNYAMLVSSAFNADWSIVSQSGWGVYTDWTNNINNAIPKCYEYVCLPAKHPSQLAIGSNDLYDFENNQTDIAIISLGANDNGALKGREWIDENGVPHKLRLLEDGSIHPDDGRLITEAVYNFCSAIRKKNKDAIILYCYNMLGGVLGDVIRAGAEGFAEDNCDKKVYTLELHRAKETMNGSRGHPGAQAHKLYADAIIAKLKEIL